MLHLILSKSVKLASKENFFFMKICIPRTCNNISFYNNFIYRCYHCIMYAHATLVFNISINIANAGTCSCTTFRKDHVLFHINLNHTAPGAVDSFKICGAYISWI